MTGEEGHLVPAQGAEVDAFRRRAVLGFERHNHGLEARIRKRQRKRDRLAFLGGRIAINEDELWHRVIVIDDTDRHAETLPRIPQNRVDRRVQLNRERFSGLKGEIVDDIERDRLDCLAGREGQGARQGAREIALERGGVARLGAAWHNGEVDQHRLRARLAEIDQEADDRVRIVNRTAFTANRVSFGRRHDRCEDRDDIRESWCRRNDREQKLLLSHGDRQIADRQFGIVERACAAEPTPDATAANATEAVLRRAVAIVARRVRVVLLFTGFR